MINDCSQIVESQGQLLKGGDCFRLLTYTFKTSFRNIIILQYFGFPHISYNTC